METIILGDCLEVMPTLDPVDAIVTDPPYGLKFMGKDWDHGLPGIPFWKAALGCAKPGAHLFAFGGTRTFHRLACALEDAGWEIRDTLMWVYGSGFPKSHNLKGEHEGWGTALKPAWEPIILARKPLEGTVAQNVQKYGTGALNIDGCRVGYSGEKVQTDWPNRKTPNSPHPMGSADVLRSYDATKGRWPANLIHDGSGEVLDLFPESKTGNLKRVNKSIGGNGIYQGGAAGERNHHGSEGSAARFFYCAKASRSERGKGNTHPTVKPIKLMEYLLRLVTPPGGTVLDPFAGSGTTLVAAKNLGIKAIGIEKSDEYAEIATTRLEGR